MNYCTFMNLVSDYGFAKVEYFKNPTDDNQKIMMDFYTKICDIAIDIFSSKKKVIG